MDSEILMVLGGSAIAAYAYDKMGFGSRGTKELVALVIMSAGVAYAVYSYTPATAGVAAVAGAAVGPVTDGVSAVADSVASML